MLSKEEVEVVLKVSPLREGNIVLDKITWELYNSFKFEYDFVRSPNMQKQLPKTLDEKKNIFSYKVLH